MANNKKTNIDRFINLCKTTQKQLKKEVANRLTQKGYEVISEDGFVYAKGEVPILLTAHLDTVHKKVCKNVSVYTTEKGKTILSSPQGIGGDDRCGVFMILEIIKKYKPFVLFCEDEERGGIGSGKFVLTEYINDLKDMKYLIELDRANANDAVFYDCDNPEFTEFIEKNTGYKESWGTFSDISTVAPECGVSAVNLSCGYYEAHTTKEYVVFDEMLDTIKVVEKLLTTESKQFEYIEAKSYYKYSRWYGYGGYTFDDDWGYSYTEKHAKSESDFYGLYIIYERKGKEYEYVQEGYSEEDAWGRFFTNPKFRNLCFDNIVDYYPFNEDEAEFYDV